MSSLQRKTRKEKSVYTYTSMYNHISCLRPLEILPGVCPGKSWQCLVPLCTLVGRRLYRYVLFVEAGIVDKTLVPVTGMHAWTGTVIS